MTTSIVAIITALAPTLTILIAAYFGRKKISSNGDKIDTVHQLVNGQMKAALERITVLEEALGLEPGELPSKPGT